MKLSIIVPVYNMVADGKLAFCLDSLVNQQLADYEIIAVNDASTDNSLELLKDYAARYPDRFVVLSLEENHRQGGAKNAGLDVARGEYVGFVDSDDFIHPQMYARMLERTEETGADMVGCDYYITYEHSFAPAQICHNNKPEQAGVLTEEKYKSLILDTGSLVIKIYKRELFEQPRLRFPEHMFYEDNAVATQLILRAKHFEYIQEPWYYYYQHNASTVHTITEQRCENRMEAMRMMLRGVAEMYSVEQEQVGGADRYSPNWEQKGNTSVVDRLPAQYRTEIEFRFTNLFYQNTLFSYVQQKKGIRLSFLRKLAKEMRETFPDFEQNPYYLARVNPEERKFIRIQQKSSLLFLLYYKLVWWVRGLRNP